MIEIPDASVAIKWFVRDSEPGLAAADEVRHRILARPDDFAVPALFVYEVHAALCRRARTERDAAEHMRALWSLAIPVVEPDEVLTELATAVAFTERLTGYDATYVALARHLRGVWLTFDEAACRRVSGRVARLLPKASA